MWMRLSFFALRREADLSRHSFSHRNSNGILNDISTETPPLSLKRDCPRYKIMLLRTGIVVSRD